MNILNDSNIFPNSSMPKFDNQTKFKLAIFTILFIISLTSNLINLIFMLTKRRQTSNHIRGFYNLILHLCIADLAVTFMSIFTELVWHITIQWFAGEIMCRLVKFGQYFFNQASMYLVVVIGIDRVHLILTSSRLSNKCVGICLASVWSLSGALSLPQSIFNTVTKGFWETDFFQCRSNMKTMFWYSILSIVLEFLVPLTLILGCYGFILYTVIRHSKLQKKNSMTFHLNLQNNIPRSLSRPLLLKPNAHMESKLFSYSGFQFNNSNTANAAATTNISKLNRTYSLVTKAPVPTNKPGPKNTTPDTIVTITPATTALTNPKLILQQTRSVFLTQARLRSFHTSSAIIISFILTRTPYWVMYFLNEIKLIDHKHQETVDILSHWFFILNISNSALNPIIYGYFNNLWLFRKSNSSQNKAKHNHIKMNGRQRGSINHNRKKQHKSNSKPGKLIFVWPDTQQKYQNKTNGNNHQHHNLNNRQNNFNIYDFIHNNSNETNNNNNYLNNNNYKNSNEYNKNKNQNVRFDHIDQRYSW